MLSKLSLRARRSLLLGITALVVSYVRSYLQYHQYSWESIEQFLASWLIHYLAIFLLVAVSYALIKTKAHLFLGKKDESHGITMEELTVYVSVVLLVAAVIIFFLAHWQPVDTYE